MCTPRPLLAQVPAEPLRPAPDWALAITPGRSVTVTSLDGSSVEGQFVAVDHDVLSIRSSDGWFGHSVLRVPISSVSLVSAERFEHARAVGLVAGLLVGVGAAVASAHRSGCNAATTDCGTGMRSVLYVIAGGALGDAVGRGVNVMSGDVILFRRPVTMAFVLSPTSGFTGGRVTIALSR